MKTFLLIVSFFTRIPVPRVEYTDERYAKGLKLVPFTGLLMGAILYGLSFVHLLIDKELTALLLLLGYIALTGGLHLDGLADTCDGVFSGRERERKLEIMKDSSTGAFGVLALIAACLCYFVLFLKAPYEGLILMPVIGKSAPVISSCMAEYIRSSGLGKVFGDNCGAVELTVALVLSAGVAWLINPWHLIPAGVGLFSVVLITLGLKRSLGGITGDTMGMVCEVSHIVFLFVLCAIVPYLE